MEIKKSISSRVNGEGKASCIYDLAECSDLGLRGIDGRILLTRSGGGERVLYPDTGKELACHQLTLTDVTENATNARQILMPGRPVATLTPPYLP